MAEPSVLPPQQYSQSSRKGKKAWRKNVDITEIQHGLEEVREQIIHGGVIAEKSSDQLFLTDTVGSTDIQKDYLRKHKPLKADEILARRSAVPAVSVRKRPADGIVTDGISAPKEKKLRLSHREYERLRKIAFGGETAYKDVVRSGDNASYDPWAVDAPARKPESSFLEQAKPVHEPKTLKEAAVSQLKGGKHVRAVSKPAAGKSYNPAYTDWLELLQRKGAKEVEAERARLEEERREAEHQALIQRTQAEEAEREALSEWESEWDSEWEGIQSETELDPEWLKKKRPERKTRAERNKIKRRKEMERRQMLEQGMRVKERQAAQVKALVQAVEERDRIRHARIQSQTSKLESSDDEDTDVELARRKGRVPIPPVPLEVVLPDELQDSLRLLRPEGNLLSERFRNMLLRGTIEARRKVVSRKKRRIQFTEKWSYKDWRLK